ncbi:myosin-binding protein 7 isoform X1 [Iris pallida]|uniref:Myosin-binding protein 7 isoform X1 n=1 Tax=Iris pallida TaxID=29817 RepID=A0AAX6DKM5_IRIPA|nr:myosin-binding protein 7 isoform X1 [Iris pallida]
MREEDNPKKCASFLDAIAMDPVAVSGCTCSCSTWQRSVKRKLLEPSAGAAAAASVDLGDEVAALREALSSQQQTIHELCAELEQEQSAASSAASEAMSMILRLQREKAEVQMESRQFGRFAEERMAHDQRELAELDEVLFRLDQAVRSLSCEVEAYRHRLASYGIDDHLAIGSAAPEPDADAGIVSPLLMATEFNLPEYDYPPVRCTSRSSGGYWDDENADLDKRMPTTTLDKLQKLESRICELETTAPRDEKLSTNALDGDDEHDGVGDDGSARVYTVDTVHRMPTTAGVSDEDEGYPGTLPQEKGSGCKAGVDGNGDISMLYRRLQSLEADRESMRQAIMSMQTEKAQHVLLREIAQKLRKEVAPERRVVVKKPSVLSTFSIAAVFKWVTSFIFWRKKASQSKYVNTICSPCLVCFFGYGQSPTGGYCFALDVMSGIRLVYRRTMLVYCFFYTSRLMPTS